MLPENVRKKISVYLEGRSGKILPIFILLMSAIFLLFQHYITSDVGFNTDEKFWIPRSYYYIEALSKFDFIGGVKSVHPGITVMAISGPFVYLAAILSGMNSYKDLIHSSIYYLAFNLPIFIFVIASYFLLHKLFIKADFDKNLSLIILMFISSNYYFVFESTPVDKFAVLSIFFSILYLLSYSRDQNRKNFYLSSFFAAFSVLSKLSSLILIPFNIAVILYGGFMSKAGYKKTAKDILIYVLIFILSSLIIYPGLIFNTIGAINAVLNAGNNALIFGGRGLVRHSLSQVVAYYLSYFGNGLFPPLIYAFFLTYVIFYAKKSIKTALKKSETNQKFYKNNLILIVFGMMYFIFIALFERKEDYRYMISFYFIASVLAASAAYYVVIFLKNKYRPEKNMLRIMYKFIIFFYVFNYVELLFSYYYGQIIVK